MATVGILAALASLFSAVQCLELHSRRQAGAFRDDTLVAFKGMRTSNDMKKWGRSGRVRAPAYTEYAAFTVCEVSGQFNMSALKTQLPAYTFSDMQMGVFVDDVVEVDECATICAQISSCTIFAGGVNCFLYTSCDNPRLPTAPGSLIHLYTFVGSSGDPHLSNLAGEKFDVNQPDDYLLLRVPREPAKPALLAMRGYVGVAEDAPCALYMKEVTLSGAWIGTKQVQVRSLKGKSFQGTWPNGWPFAMKTSSTSPESQGQWRSWENFTAEGTAAETLPRTVAVTTVFRKEEAAAGRVMEAQAFEFRIGTQVAEERASILVAQGSHEGLDISLSKVSMFHEPELGGLLGTEKHDKKVEARTKECEAGQKKRTMMKVPAGSVFTASWV